MTVPALGIVRSWEATPPPTLKPVTIPVFTACPAGTAQWVWDNKIVHLTIDEALRSLEASGFSAEPCDGIWAQVFCHAEGYSVRFMLGLKQVSGYQCHG